MNLTPAINNLEKYCSKGLYTILLVAGFFVFGYPATIPQPRFAAQATEYVHSGNSVLNGFKYSASFNRVYNRLAAHASPFVKANLSLAHTKQALTSLKRNLQTVLSVKSFSGCYFVKSIPQSGKKEPFNFLG